MRSDTLLGADGSDGIWSALVCRRWRVRTAESPDGAESTSATASLGFWQRWGALRGRYFADPMHWLDTIEALGVLSPSGFGGHVHRPMPAAEDLETTCH